jgi:hypothetical protein
MSAAFDPVFVIEEDEENPPENGRLIDTADRAVGTLGFCGALLAVCACWVCCGQCAREVRESYNRHTLFGLCCPWTQEPLESSG